MPRDSEGHIELSGVRVHNLQNVELKLPLGRLTVLSGVSGSGKSSLAFDTLYAEGQRRYIECFSAYARQFLDRLEKPDADRIDNIPPALAVKQNSVRLSSKATVSTTTELHDYLRLLFAKLGRIVCPDCGIEVRTETPDDARPVIQQLAPGARYQVGFPVDCADTQLDAAEVTDRLQKQGFTRAIAGGKTVRIAECREALAPGGSGAWVVVDRLTAGREASERVADSLETAFQQGDERAVLLVEQSAAAGSSETPPLEIDGKRWAVHRFSGNLVCAGCGREFLPPEPRLFSFHHPLGACAECRGFGAVPAISFERLVPDPSKTLREGAIAAWTTPAYRHELEELLDLADDYQLPVDVPFCELQASHRQLILAGVPERNFGGLTGFFRWLQRHKYKLGVRVFLNRWQAYETCPRCRGDRLQPQALAVRVSGRSIAEIGRLTVRAAEEFFQPFADDLSDSERTLVGTVLEEIRSRLGYLAAVGLDYLSLDRQMKTLSAGEAQRVALTALLGSSLVNTLYVLDEPSAGLHPHDSDRVIDAVLRLRDAGNTVVVVEHEFSFLKAADVLVDVGPGGGREGGRILYAGPPAGVVDAAESHTGAYLSGRAAIPVRGADRRRPAGDAAVVLRGAREHNLQNIDATFPLGLLCVVTGVSGSGKSTLIVNTLFPALCRRLGQSCDVFPCGPCDGVDVSGQLDQVVLVDQSPIGRTPRSSPVTYLKAFDDVRRSFAETPDARMHDLTAASFSFNAKAGGRCGKCHGSGRVVIDMQFLADVSMTCPECLGTRYQRSVLDVKYRGLNIHEVLNLTVREAFAFFRGKSRIQRKLKFLIDVGLDYLPLGQPATTLSGGESQRLKLAAFLASGTRARTLFLIDEPTTGLHAADIAKLLDCLDSLIAVGHSVIVIEHNLDVIRAADHVIDLGPGAGEQGGRIVAAGPPEHICRARGSLTGQSLNKSAAHPARPAAEELGF